jgi:O-antigen ligase
MSRQNWLACQLFLLLAPGFLTTCYTRAYNALHLEMFAFLGWGVLIAVSALTLSKIENLRLNGTTATYAGLLFGLPALVLLGQQAFGIAVPYFGMVIIAIYYLLVGACTCLLGSLAAAWFRSLSVTSSSGLELVNAVLKAFLGVAAVSALAGIAQYLQLPLPEFLVSPVTQIGASYGNLRQQNLFALLGVLGLVALIVLRNTAGHFQWRSSGFSALLFLTLLIAVVLSTSRTGALLIGVISVWGLVESWRARQLKWMLLLALPSYLLFRYIAVQIDSQGLLPFYGTSRLGLISTALEGDYWRQIIWTKSLALIQTHPVWGVGFGNIAYAMFTETLPVPSASVTEHAHNIFLQMAVELGVPIAAGWALMLVFLIIRSRHVLRTFKGRSLAVFLLAVMIHSLLEYPLWYAYFLLPSAFAFGVFTQIGALDEAEMQVSSKSLVDVSQAPHQASNTAAVPNDTDSYVKALGISSIFTIVLALFGLWDYAKVSPSYELNSSVPLPDRVIQSYTSVLFLNLADYSALGLTGVSPATAPVQLRLANRVAHFRFDPQVAATHAAAAALTGQLDLARASAYRLWLKDKDAAEKLRLALAASSLPQALKLSAFLDEPTFVPWP